MDPGSSPIINKITDFLILKHESEGKLEIPIMFFSEKEEKEGGLVFPFFSKTLKQHYTLQHHFLQKLGLLQGQLVLT